MCSAAAWHPIVLYNERPDGRIADASKQSPDWIWYWRSSCRINTSDGTAGAQNYTFISRDTAVVNGVTISSIGFYSLTARTVKVKVCLRNSANNYDIVSDTSYSHGGTGWEDVSITPYAVPGSGTYYIGGYCSAGGANPKVKTSAARTYKSGDVTGTGQTTTAEDTSTAFPLRYTYS